MATIFSHALLGVAAARVAYPEDSQRRIALWAAALSILPDADVLAFGFGVAYGDFWGHRGFSHSLLFALLVSLVVVATRFREKPGWTGRSWRLVAFFFLVTASHGMLDALTDGGLGIAFFAPFENSRYFLPWSPLPVSPIGRGFFSEEGMEVLLAEALWIGLPCVLLLILARLLEFRRKIAATLKPPVPRR